MVFVTIGNGREAFGRLLDGVRRAVDLGVIDAEELLVQYGHTPPAGPPSARLVSFLPEPEFLRAISEANLVIAHAGAGTLIRVLQAGRVPVVMPRRRRYGEVVDDHQVDLATAFEAAGRVVVAAEPEDIPAAVRRARSLPCGIEPGGRPGALAVAVRDAIRELMEVLP